MNIANNIIAAINNFGKFTISYQTSDKIVIGQHIQPIIKHEKDEVIYENGKEHEYELKVLDHETKSTMYYETKLVRVEVEKDEEKTTNVEPLEEHMEVIAELDDEDENPFQIEFEEIKE